MDLIIPAAGQSTRFPNVRPKWMLTHPNGNMMVIEAIRGLNLQDFDSIHVGVLQEHIKVYPCLEGLKGQFSLLGYADKLNLIILEKATASQPETIASIISKAGIKGPIFCKDVDNYFAASIYPGNSLGLCSLSQTSQVNPANKSYAEVDHQGWVQNIVEKKIISEFFCVGGYGFHSAEQFLDYFNSFKEYDNLYVSDIIFKMLLDNLPFSSMAIEHYRDWGTLEDWNRFTREYATLFIDLDGALVENSSEYVPPLWGETKGIDENIHLIKRYFASGKVHVVITTSRGEHWRDATIKQLEREGIPYHRILFGLFHAQRIIIKGFATGSPFPGAVAVNLHRDQSQLEDYLQHIL